MNFALLLCGLLVINLAVSDSFKLFRSERSDDALPSECLTLPEFGKCGSPVYHNNYYFDVSTGKCKKFLYNYCEDHGNNFWFLRDCISTCSTGEIDNADFDDFTEEEETYDNICDYPPETGMCLAAFQTYFFDGEKCEVFLYGGCGGTPNNFITKEDCMKQCMPDDEVGSVPEPPRECSATNQSSHSLSVDCDPGYDGGLTQTFHLELYNSVAGQVAANLTSEEAPSFKVHELPPGTTFVLVLYASNSKGRSKALALMASTLLPPE